MGEEIFAKLTPQLPATASALLFGQSIVVTLPADAKLEAKTAALLDKLSPDALTEHAKSISCRLSGKVPDGQSQKILEQDARTYFAMSTAFVVPPWSPGFKLEDDERKARVTYARIAEVHMRTIMEPRFVDQRKRPTRISAKERTPSPKCRRHSAASATTLTRRRPTRFAATLRRSIPRCSICTSSEPRSPAKGADPVKRQVDLTLRMARRMGQLPLENGKPKPGAERFSANGGVRVVGSRLRFDWLSFRQTDAGLPALAQWLCSAHCTDIKYRLTAPCRPGG